MSDSLRPHESQHAGPPCPSPNPWVHSDSFPLSQWCHPVHLILGRPLLLLPPTPPSIRVFSNELTLCIRWPEYWSFSFSIIPSKEIPGLISFRMDWLDLLAVQGTLKSLLQHHSSKASILHMWVKIDYFYYTFLSYFFFGLCILKSKGVHLFLFERMQSLRKLWGFLLKFFHCFSGDMISITSDMQMTPHLRQKVKKN